MSQRNLLILLLAFVISYSCYVRGEQNPYARYISDGLAVIEGESLERVPSDDLFRGAMEGMVDVLREHGDDHSQFVPEGEAEPMRTEIRQQFGGIGVRIGFQGDPPRLLIVGRPDPGTPAAEARLQAGDWIIAIDGHPTRDISMEDVLALMRGEPGTTIQLAIQRPHDEEPQSMELVREVINIESILGDRRNAAGEWVFPLESDPRIAHVRIQSFGDRTAIELTQAIEKVTEEGVQALVLDLRDNAGGSLDAAVAVCELFLPAGQLIVETRGRGQSLREQYATTTDGRFLDVPMAVLVNQESASASEIVAACLQDHGRAVVVGQRTYGKGTVQQLVPLESGRSLLKLTWASFWRPSGARIHRSAIDKNHTDWGVMPSPRLDRTLTPEEYAEYREYRIDRDLAAPKSGENNREANGEINSANFVDQHLRVAVEYLRDELDKDAP